MDDSFILGGRPRWDYCPNYTLPQKLEGRPEPIALGMSRTSNLGGRMHLYGGRAQDMEAYTPGDTYGD